MATAFSTYMDPSVYSEAAVAAATAGDAEELSNDLRIIRLTCAIRDNDLAAANKLVALLEQEGLEGHALFKLRTAGLFLAAKEADQAGFDWAFSRWKEGRDAYPANWIDEVLDAPEIRPWLPVMHAAFVRQREAARRALTKDELTFVRDLSFCITRAVQDNLEWLRPHEPSGAIADLVDKYRLAAVDLNLKEATLDGRGKLPDLIVALDEGGNYTGSFIAH
jgi:hypothetical protein